MGNQEINVEFWWGNLMEYGQLEDWERDGSIV
jgi:hypothetical protein